jgi:hypothetical protein
MNQMMFAVGPSLRSGVHLDSMSSCETLVDTTSQSMSRRLSSGSYCDLYADVERTLHLQKDDDNRSNYRERSMRKVVECSERKLSPRRQNYPQKSDVASNYHRSLSFPESQGSRKSFVDNEATNATIPAQYEYEVALEGSHNAEQLSNTPTSDTGSTLSQEELEIIQFLMNKTRVRPSTRLLSPKMAPRRTSSSGVEGVARRNSERSYSSKRRGNLPHKDSLPSQEVRNARMTSSNSRPREQSFDSQASEHNQSSSRSPPRQRNIESHASDIDQSCRSEAGDLRRRKRSPHPRATHNDRVKSLSVPTSRASITQTEVSPLVERRHSKSLSRKSDPGPISATAGYSSRSTADVGPSVRKRTPNVPEGKRDKEKDKRKGKDKSRDKGMKETPTNNKVKGLLTTRGWRAKLAEHFGRTAETNPSMGKTFPPIPSTVLCSEHFAFDIMDDLTEIP